MTISIQCPVCKKKLKAKDELAGKQVACPSCGRRIVIQVPGATPRASAPSQLPHEPPPIIATESTALVGTARRRFRLLVPAVVGASVVGSLLVVGLAWWLLSRSASTEVSRVLTDSLFGRWKLVEAHDSPPSIHDEQTGILILEESGYGAYSVRGYPDVFLPMKFTLDDPQEPKSITYTDPGSGRLQGDITVESLSNLRLALRWPYTRTSISSSGEQKVEVLFEKRIYEKLHEDVPARSPDDVAAVRNLGAVVLLDDAGDVESVDLYPLAAVSDVRPPTIDIGDDDLRVMSEFSNLRKLNAPCAKITDAGLVHIQRLANLESLSLGGNPITDAGLVHLQRLTNLKSLYLQETAITDVGLQRFRSARPTCKIKH